MANCSPFAYWVGHTEDQGVTSDIDGRLSLYFNGTDVWDKSEPNDLTGVENCVRLHGDRYRDAKCDLQSTDHARSGIGMGYICEFDESKGTLNPFLTLIFKHYHVWRLLIRQTLSNNLLLFQ